MALYVQFKQNEQPKQVTSIYKGLNGDGSERNPFTPKIIAAVYKGAKLLWQYIKSCFGRGYWINDKMWSDKDAWAN